MLLYSLENIIRCEEAIVHGHDPLTVDEAAQVLGYSPQHTRKLIREGLLMGVKRGRDWFVAAEAVKEYIARRDAKPKGKGRPRQGAGTQEVPTSDAVQG